MEPNNWDLQAVVSGCCFTSPTATASVDPFSSFPPPMPGQQEEEEELVRVSFPDLLQTTPCALYELEELCKPFILSTLHHQPQQEQHHDQLHHRSSATHQPQQPRHPQRPQTQISRSKRRKNQQKKVVCQVPADGASSDLWAWRKYGQKPIKGSPFPRGYYRCSSSKGCPARKQVERSRTDPGTLVITYTAEHNHPIPTHRSSLAGSTRHKFSPTTSSAKPPAAPGSDNPPELLQRRRRRPEHGEEGVEAAEEDEDDDEDDLLMVENMEMLGEDGILFVDLVEPGGSGTHAAASPADAVSAASAFDGGYGEHFYLPPWLASNNTAAAAGGR